MNIVILHGWGSCAKKWEKVKEILEKKGLRVFVPDLPGFGESLSPDRPWSSDDYANWVEDFAKDHIKGSFFLLGHSFGGKIALKTVLKIPEKIPGLIFVAPPIFRWTPDLKARLLGFCWKKIDPMAKPLLKYKFFRKIFNLVRLIFYTCIIKKPDYLKFTEAMKKTFEIVNKEDFSALLPEVRTKTLIIWGEKDKIIPLKYAYLIKEKISNSKIEIIPQVGHSPHLEDPEKLSEIILKFLRV